MVRPIHGFRTWAAALALAALAAGCGAARPAAPGQQGAPAPMPQAGGAAAQPGGAGTGATQGGSPADGVQPGGQASAPPAVTRPSPVPPPAPPPAQDGAQPAAGGSAGTAAGTAAGGSAGAAAGAAPGGGSEAAAQPAAPAASQGGGTTGAQPAAPANGQGGGEPAGAGVVAGPVPFQTLAQGHTSGYAQAGARIITTAAEWQAFWRQHAAVLVPAPAPPAVDFSREAVLVVSLGEKRTGGYSVEVTGVRREGDRLVVRAKVRAPGPGAIVTMALTQPYHMVRIPRLPVAAVAVEWQ